MRSAEDTCTCNGERRASGVLRYVRLYVRESKDTGHGTDEVENEGRLTISVYISIVYVIETGDLRNASESQSANFESSAEPRRESPARAGACSVVLASTLPGRMRKQLWVLSGVQVLGPLPGLFPRET